MGTQLNVLSVASGGPYIPLAAAGSSRYRSYVWPEPFAEMNSTTSTPQTGGRLQQVAGVGITTSGYGGGIANNPGLINQTVGVLCTTTAAAGVGSRMQGQILPLKTSRSNVIPSLGDDMHCMRYWANIACSSGTVVGNDQGFFFIPGGGLLQRIFADVAVGFGFSIGQNGVVQWVVRGPNGLIQANLTALPFDITIHHTYEVIIVGATKTADAYLVALIDSVVQPLPVLSRSWAAGTNLPPNVSISGISSFAAQVTADSHVLNATLHCHQLGMVWGPTPQSLY